MIFDTCCFMVELESCKLDFCSKSSKSLCLTHVESVVNSAATTYLFFLIYVLFNLQPFNASLGQTH